MLTGVIARYFDAWNDHDAAACAGCLPRTASGSGGCSRHRTSAGPLLPGLRGPRRHRGPDRPVHGLGARLEPEVSALSEGSDDRVWTEEAARHPRDRPRALAGAR